MRFAMSAYWDSRLVRAVRRVGRFGGLILALGSLLAGSVEAAQPARGGSTDSGRVVRRVQVSDRGIEVQGQGQDQNGHVRVRVDAQGVEIEEMGADSAVSHVRRVIGPGMVVDVGEAGLVRLFSDAEVRAGERVDGDVVAVFGSVLVDGQVSGDVVAVFGSVQLGPEASVGGDAVSVGGSLDQAPGAIVSGQSVSLGFLPMHFGAPPLQLMLTTVLAGWALSLLVGWLLLLLFPERMLRIAATASRRTAGSFALGLLSAPLLVIAIVLLLVTVIGIPLAILLPPIFVLAVWAGQLATSYVLGCRLLRRRLGDRPPFLPLVAGTLFVALFFVLGVLLSWPAGVARTAALFFNLLGGLLILGLSVIGTGAVMLSRVGSRPTDIGGDETIPSAPAEPPTASPAEPPATPIAPPPSPESPPAL